MTKEFAGISPGRVTSFAWTSDGYGLAAGYEKGWAVWSMGGRLGGWGLSEGEDGNRDGEEGFMHGVNDLVGVLRSAYLVTYR